MSCRMLGPWLAACIALSCAMPAAAQESLAPTTPVAPQRELPSTWAFDTDWKVKDDASARQLAGEREVEMWSIALIGPAAMILFVTILGLTITVRSLRKDFRRQRDQTRDWRHGALSRASRGSRG
jgi:hypothetical protein